MSPFDSNFVETPPSGVPELAPDGRTLIFDVRRKRQVLWIQGTVVLPIGATVQLGPLNLDARVVGVRLLIDQAAGSATVCLDTEVPARYWRNQPA